MYVATGRLKDLTNEAPFAAGVQARTGSRASTRTLRRHGRHAKVRPGVVRHIYASSGP